MTTSTQPMKHEATVGNFSSTELPLPGFLEDLGPTKKALPDRLNLLHDSSISRKAEGSPVHAVPLSVEADACFRLSAGAVCIQDIRETLPRLREAVQEARHV